MSINFRMGPAENDIQCFLCGSLFSHELTRCPNCGASLYSVEVSGQDSGSASPARAGLLTNLRRILHSLLHIPYSAQEVFGDPLDLAALYDVLVDRLGGDSSAAERLVQFEHRLLPSASRFACVRKAIQRLEADDDPAHPGS